MIERNANYLCLDKVYRTLDLSIILRILQKAFSTNGFIRDVTVTIVFPKENVHLNQGYLELRIMKLSILILIISI